MIAWLLDARLSTRPNPRQVWAALTLFANLMTQGAGSLAIKNVLPSLDKILDWRIRCQDEFLGGILTQLRNAVPHPQKEADERHIKRKHLQECPHTPASLVTNSRFWLQCWRCDGMQHRLFLLMPLRPQMGQPEN